MGSVAIFPSPTFFFSVSLAKDDFRNLLPFTLALECVCSRYGAGVTALQKVQRAGSDESDATVSSVSERGLTFILFF